MDLPLKERLRQLPNTPGVYWMKDRFGHTLYVGKAKNLKKRVSTYFQPSRKQALTQPKVAAMIDLVAQLDWLEVRNEAEALLLEGRLIKEWRPRYNTDFTDDKRFLLVRVDMSEAIPLFRSVRNALEDGARYFGPFANAGFLRETLRGLRQRYGIALGDAKPQALGGDQYQLYNDVRAQIFHHPNKVAKIDYHQRALEACKALEGTAKAYKIEIEAAMASASENQDYEKAAQLRDLLWALNETLRPTRRFLREPTALKPNNHSALEALKTALNLPRLPNSIEGFDISHISGTFTVASMVHFYQGQPLKKAYRRFKIQSHTTNNDFQSMAEVVGRRYARLHAEGKSFPDLVLIDGGIGQISAACLAFEAQGLALPPIIGLAKREETIVFPDGRTLKLPAHDLALRLLQHVRDEAHRFANSFNAALRSKRIKESILTSIPGLGEKKRSALLSHFKTLEAIKAASVKTLTTAPGIGPSLAQAIFSHLCKNRDPDINNFTKNKDI